MRCFLGFCHECLNLYVVFVFVVVDVVVVVLNVVVVVDDDVAAVEIFNVNFFRPIHFSNALSKSFQNYDNFSILCTFNHSTTFYFSKLFLHKRFFYKFN